MEDRMTNSKIISTLDAIYGRRAIRDYKADAVDSETVRALLDAAIHAPTAMHEEPWSFVVIQDKNLLDKLSESAKQHLRAEYKDSKASNAEHMLDFANDPQFRLFYNAGTLVVLCSKNQGPMGIADTWLAAENLMLAAYAKGLGSCVIGLAIGALNAPEWKEKLGIPPGTAAVAPIIVGVPKKEAPVSPRKPPEIIAWKK